jgi:formylglycine-generating enzyme required for sulfatase activity
MHDGVVGGAERLRPRRRRGHRGTRPHVPEDAGSMTVHRFPQPEIFGRFVVLDVLDDGLARDGAGAGRVWGPVTHKALDLDRELAPVVTLQRLPPSLVLPRKERTAFEAAFQWHERIVDEHVVGCVGTGTLDGVAWRAREWVDGVTIDDVVRAALAKNKPLPASFVLTSVYILGCGLIDAAERAPDNLLVGLQPRGRRVLLTADGHVKMLGPTVLRATPGPDERLMPSFDLFPNPAHYEAGCFAALLVRLCTGFGADGGVVDEDVVSAPGPLGALPAELVRSCLSAWRGQTALRDLMTQLRPLMQAAGGGQYADVSSTVTSLFPVAAAKAAREREQLVALARRLRARRRPRTEPGLPSRSASMFELRQRPASQEGPPLASTTGAPVVDVPDDMVLIPGGRYLFQPVDAEPTYVDVAPFLLDRVPVTCAAWAVFCRETGTTPPSYWPLPLQWYPDPDNLSPAMRDAPVVQVGRDDAARYARWAGKRLPTEVEWELAARGFDGRLWPWGHEFDAAKAGEAWREPWTEREPVAVTSLDPSSSSPYGVLGIGLAWEWTSTQAGALARKPEAFIVRGGAWRNRAEPPSLVNRSFEDEPAPDVTFRCARDVDGSAARRPGDDDRVDEP